MSAAPSPAIASAQARPMPLPAPVTSATLPLSRPMLPPMRFHEGDDVVDGPVALGQHGMDHVPDMDHVLPHIERACDAGFGRTLVQIARIVEQHLVASGMDEKRRQSLKIAKQR